MRLFVYDEARFGLHEGITRRRLTARGVKPVQRVFPRYKYFWLFGAVEPLTGESLFLEMPALDTPCFQAFVDEFCTTFPDSFNVLVLDGAPCHKAKSLRISSNLLLIFLPPDSPELNPAERVWQDLRGDLSDEPPTSLAALAGQTRTLICAYTPDALASLTRFDYLREIIKCTERC